MSKLIQCCNAIYRDIDSGALRFVAKHTGETIKNPMAGAEFVAAAFTPVCYPPSGVPDSAIPKDASPVDRFKAYINYTQGETLRWFDSFNDFALANLANKEVL